MALWDKLRVELDRAGRVAQVALDEGKLRLEAFRARQLVDKSAATLGYAVYRSRTGQQPLDDAALVRLIDAVAEREREVQAIEARLRDAEQASRGADRPADAPPS